MTSAAVQNTRVREKQELIRDTIESELAAMERGDLRSELQVAALFNLLEDASREQIARAERLQIATLIQGRLLTEIPVLGIDVETQSDGSVNISYFENHRGEKLSQEDLNPTSRDSLFFRPNDIRRTLLGIERDARLITPTLTTLRRWPDEVNAEKAEILTRAGTRLTRFDGIPATWDINVDLKAWSTNIDTVYFSNWLKAAGVLNDSVKQSLEVGCGIGGISQVVVASCQALQRHVFTDIDPNAINATRRNLRPLLSNQEVTWYIGKGVEGLAPPEGFDLIVGNPPYIPDPDGAGDTNHWSGTKLLRRLFSDGIRALNPNNPDACVCVQISSVTLPDFERYVHEHPNVEVTRIGGPVRVPLRILGLLRDERVLEFLKQQGHLEFLPKDPMQYYHEIMAYKLTPRRP